MLQTVGWDVTEIGTTSKLQLSYEEYTRCIPETQVTFRRYLTTDKFCSILKDGKTFNLNHSSLIKNSFNIFTFSVYKM